MVKNNKNPINTIIIVNSSLIVISLIIILLFYSGFPRNIPLFFSKPWGKDQLANKYFIFIIPFLSLFFLILSIILRKGLNTIGNIFLEITPLVFSLIFSTILIISLFKIIMLVY